MSDVAAILALLSCAVFAIAVPVVIIRALMKKTIRNWLLAALSSFALLFGAVIITLSGPTDGKKPTSVGNLAKGSGAPTVEATPTEQPFPGYLELRGGQRALLDSNNEGSGSMGTLFDDLATVRKWASGQFNGPEDLPHRDFPVGTRVVVRSWTHVKAVGGDDYIMINVMTLTNPRREGYVRDIDLLPMIPSGARLVVRSTFLHARGVTMELRRDGSRHLPSLTIAEGTSVSLLAVAPNGDSLSPYRAQVLSGPHRGARGWFDVFSLRAPSPPVKAGEYDEKCRCVSLYLAEVRPPATQPRPIEAATATVPALTIDPSYHASMPTAEPAPPESPETTRDYMNEACILMYDGAHYGFDFGSPGGNSNMRIVNCSGGDLVYFRREHLAETKAQYQSDKSPPNTPGGYPVPILGASGATPFPRNDK